MDNLYTIHIVFRSALIGGEDTHIKKIECKDASKKSFIDDFRFFQNVVSIKAKRPFVLSHNDLIDTDNSIRLQILKGVLLFYANCINYPKIKSIKVNIDEPLDSGRSQKYNYEYKTLDIQQVIPLLKYHRKLYFYPNSDYYSEDAKGNALLIALSHWLAAISLQNDHLKFDHLWTALNALYSYYDSKDREDLDQQIYLWQEIKAKEASFTKSKDIVHTYDLAKLKDFSWGLLCQDDFSRHRGKADNVCQMMQRYDEERVHQLFSCIAGDQDLIPTFRLSPEFPATMTKIGNLGINSDIELVLLLGIRYAYFLRNHKLHGHEWAYEMRMWNTAKDRTLPDIDHLLETLVFEILSQPSVITPKS